MKQKIDETFIERFKSGKIVIFFKEGEDPIPCLEILGRNEIKWLSEERADAFSPRWVIGERPFYIRMVGEYLVHGENIDSFGFLTCNEGIEEIVKWNVANVEKEVGDRGMTIEKAIRRLREEYGKLQATKYIKDPVSYALCNVLEEAVNAFKRGEKVDERY